MGDDKVSGKQKDNEGWEPGDPNDPDGVIERWNTDAFQMSALERTDLREHNSYHHAMTVLNETSLEHMTTMIEAQMQAILDFQLDRRGFDRLDFGVMALFDAVNDVPRLVMGARELVVLFNEGWSMAQPMMQLRAEVGAEWNRVRQEWAEAAERLGRPLTDAERDKIAFERATELQNRILGVIEVLLGGDL
jgi:hypothetical protein